MNELTISLEEVLKRASMAYTILSPHKKKKEIKPLVDFIENNASIHTTLTNLYRDSKRPKQKFKEGMYHKENLPKHTKEAAVMKASEIMASLHGLVHAPIVRDHKTEGTRIPGLHEKNASLFENAVACVRG